MASAFPVKFLREKKEAWSSFYFLVRTAGTLKPWPPAPFFFNVFSDASFGGVEPRKRPAAVE